MRDLSKEPTRSWISGAQEQEAKVEAIVWEILAAHYPGAIDPKNPSLMAERLFRVARSCYNDAHVRLEAEYEDGYTTMKREIERLEAENRALRGLPPLPPVAIA